MTRRVVADSSANLRNNPDGSFASAPLKIIIGGREFIDDENLDKQELLQFINTAKGTSSTSSPNIADWFDSFGNADEVFTIALTSKISSGYNSACTAASQYEYRYQGTRVFVLDAKSTGPESELLAERAMELAATDASFGQIANELQLYAQRTHLMFALKSVDNFARNGRVNPAIAKACGMLNIRIVGQASALGELEMLNKSRGEKAALAQLYSNMKDAGFDGGKVRIRHTQNLELAQKLAELVQHDFPSCDLKVAENEGLCSYYAEPGSILVGFVSE